MGRTQEPSREDARAENADPAARFLDAIAEGASLPPHVTPVAAAIATTCPLLDRLTPGQAHDLIAALPDEVRPLFERCDLHRDGERAAWLGRAELVDRVAAHLGLAPVAAELVVGAVFRALEASLPQETIAHVAQQLPRDLQELWTWPVLDTAEEIATERELLPQVLGDIDRSGALPTHVSARRAFAVVMCLFSERLSGGEAKDLFLGLPRTLRPLVEACMIPRRERAVAFEAEELFAAVASDLDMELDAAPAVVAAVVAAVTRVLPSEELAHVESQLPDDLRAIWTA